MGSQSVGKLVEQHRGRGDGQTTLLGMLTVVQTDAKDTVRASDHRGQGSAGKTLRVLEQGGQQPLQLASGEGNGGGHIFWDRDAQAGGLGSRVYHPSFGLESQGGPSIAPKLHQFHKRSLLLYQIRGSPAKGWHRWRDRVPVPLW